MGRPREFDEDEILERATRVFWERGYEAASITDLLEATGLAKGSLYKAFRDKRSLFLKALERYLAEGRQTLRQRIREADSGAEALADWLRAVGRMATRGTPRRGCFGVNSTVECAPHDPETRALLREHARAVERLYAEAIQRGVDEGAFRNDVDVDTAARFVTVVVHGLQTLGRGGLDPVDVEPIVASALDGLR